jgi:hypothetical protein
MEDYFCGIMGNIPVQGILKINEFIWGANSKLDV